MTDNRPYWKVVLSLFFSLGATIFVIIAGAKLIGFFAPFVVGYIISLIANPVVKFLEEHLNLGRRHGSIIIIIGVIALIVGLCYWGGSTLFREIYKFIMDSPDIYRDVETTFNTLGTKLEGVFKFLPQTVQMGLTNTRGSIDQTMSKFIATISQPTVSAASNFASKLPSVFIGIIVAMVSAYFFVAQRDQVLAVMKKVTPEPVAKRLNMIVDGLKYAVGGYFKAQFKIMGIMAVILFIGLLILRIHYAILICIVVAFLDFLPFFGTGTILIPWAVVEFLMGDYKTMIGLIVLYVICLIVHQAIQPKMVGDTIGMDPLVTLVFIYIGYKLGGLIWMILAVPIGMIVINLYKAGAFDYILDDVIIIIHGIMDLRKNE